MDFDPTGNALAYTGADSKVYVINSRREADKPPKNGHLTDLQADDFGAELLIEKINGWGNCVVWSPNGKSFTVVTQGNNLHVISVDSNAEIIKEKKKKKKSSQSMFLPLTRCFYNGEEELIATGFDAVPFKFTLDGGRW